MDKLHYPSDRREEISPARLAALRPFVPPLLGWFAQNARPLPWRENRDAYRVWVSEIMLQQTRVEVVIPYYRRFLAALPDLAALAGAPQDMLLKLWEGLGYYSRVRNMQRAAQAVLAAGGQTLPGSYAALLSLPGIGPYTAGAVASIAFGEAVPAVDGNVLRVLARLLACGADIALPPVKRAFEQAAAFLLPPDVPGNFNQAMMELGATVCLPNGAPACGACPVRAFCAAARAGVPEQYPYKSPKKPRVLEERTVVVVMAENKVLLRRRPAKGLLAGLWELPNLSGRLSAGAAADVAAGWGLAPLKISALGEAKHIFTHIEWRMSGFAVRCADCVPVAGAVWATAEELAARYALPSALRAYARRLPVLFGQPSAAK